MRMQFLHAGFSSLHCSRLDSGSLRRPDKRLSRITCLDSPFSAVMTPCRFSWHADHLVRVSSGSRVGGWTWSGGETLLRGPPCFGKYLERLGAQLSSGQAQRVRVCRYLAMAGRAGFSEAPWLSLRWPGHHDVLADAG